MQASSNPVGLEVFANRQTTTQIDRQTDSQILIYAHGGATTIVILITYPHTSIQRGTSIMILVKLSIKFILLL